MLCLACIPVTLHVLGFWKENLRFGATQKASWHHPRFLLYLVVCNNGLFRHFLSVILMKQPISEEMTTSFTHASDSSFPTISDHAKFEFPNVQTFHASSHSKKSAENVGSTTFRAQVRRSETPEFANRPGFQHLVSWVLAAVFGSFETLTRRFWVEDIQILMFYWIL